MLKYLALVPVLLIAGPAAAQSLHETHERVWMPAGKSPVVTWRMRDRAPQVAQSHHQAGKGMMPARREEARAEAPRQPGAHSPAGSD